jgi:hypothetical protein
MHPYVAYRILSSPANRQPRPDECCASLREILTRLRQRWPLGAAGRR